MRRPFCVLNILGFAQQQDVYSCYQVYALDVPKLFMSNDNKHIGCTVLHVLESQFLKFQNFPHSIFRCPFFIQKCPCKQVPPPPPHSSDASYAPDQYKHNYSDKTYTLTPAGYDLFHLTSLMDSQSGRSDQKFCLI